LCPKNDRQENHQSTHCFQANICAELFIARTHFPIYAEGVVRPSWAGILACGLAFQPVQPPGKAAAAKDWPPHDGQ
jgi:hypothetical protein